jgi:hypothetical protein
LLRTGSLDHGLAAAFGSLTGTTVAQAAYQILKADEVGFSRAVTMACGINGKGPWRSSETPSMQQALSNDYLEAEELVSV